MRSQIRQISVGAPLRDIAVHIMKTPLIGLFPAHRMQSARAVAGVPPHVVELACSGKWQMVAGAAGVFPLGLGGQSVEPTIRRTQPLAEGHRVAPGHPVHRQPRIFRAGNGRQATHNATVLTASHLRSAEPERLGDVDEMYDFIQSESRFVVVTAHAESPGRHSNELHAQVICLVWKIRRHDQRPRGDGEHDPNDRSRDQCCREERGRNPSLPARAGLNAGSSAGEEVLQVIGQGSGGGVTTRRRFLQTLAENVRKFPVDASEGGLGDGVGRRRDGVADALSDFRERSGDGVGRLAGDGLVQDQAKRVDIAGGPEVLDIADGLFGAGPGKRSDDVAGDG